MVLGGGTGAPVSVKTLLSLGFETSAIVAMADDGGSTGILRQLPDITAPGDIRKCLLAFADTDDPLVKRRAEIFNTRLVAADNHSLGNLILGAYERKLGSFRKAIASCEELLHAKGHVIPSICDQVTLSGIDVHGNTISGQANICHAVEPMQHVFLRGDKPLAPNKDALRAIKEADLVVLGPGSLFTSILPNLLVPGVVDALRSSKATVVFVCPITDAQGETRGMDVKDCLRAIERHGLEGRINAVVVNRPKYGNGERTYLAHDRRMNLNVYSVPYAEDELQEIRDGGVAVILRSLADNEYSTWHNPRALREALLEVCSACPLP